MSLNKIDKIKKFEFPKIQIEAIPQSEQRYETLGDWFFVEKSGVFQSRTLCILVSKQEGPDSSKKEYLLALHEFIEAMHCSFEGITQKQVDDFDMGISKEQVIKDGFSEHGFHEKAPYRKQHEFAYMIECLAAREIGLELDSLINDEDFYDG
jgi:hypothetical protein